MFNHADFRPIINQSYFQWCYLQAMYLKMVEIVSYVFNPLFTDYSSGMGTISKFSKTYWFNSYLVFKFQYGIRLKKTPLSEWNEKCTFLSLLHLEVIDTAFNPYIMWINKL